MAEEKRESTTVDDIVNTGKEKGKANLNDQGKQAMSFLQSMDVTGKKLVQETADLNTTGKKTAGILGTVVEIAGTIADTIGKLSKNFEESMEVARRNGMTRQEYAQMYRELHSVSTNLEKSIISSQELTAAMKNLSSTWGFSNQYLASGLAQTNAIAAQMLNGQWNQATMISAMRGGSLTPEEANRLSQQGVANQYNLQQQFEAQYGMSDYITSGAYNSTQQMLTKLEVIAKNTGNTSLTLSNDIQKMVGGIYELVGEDKSGLTTQLQNIANGKLDSINVGMWQALSSSGVNLLDILQGRATDSDYSSIANAYTNNWLGTYSDENAWALVGALGYGEYDAYTKAQVSGKTTKDLMGDSVQYQARTYEGIEKLYSQTKLIGDMMTNFLGNFYQSTGLGQFTNAYGTQFASLFNTGSRMWNNVKSIYNDIGSNVLSGLFSGLTQGGSVKNLVSGLKSANWGGIAKGASGILGAGLMINDAANVSDGLYSDSSALNGLGGAFLGQDYSGADGFKNGLANVGKYTALGGMFGPWGALIGAAVGVGATIAGKVVQDEKRYQKENKYDNSLEDMVDAYSADFVIKNTEVTTSTINDNIVNIANILQVIAGNTKGEETVAS